MILVKNETDRELSRFSILGLDVPLFTPENSLASFKREVTFRGIVPAASHHGKFAVLHEPALPGMLALGYLSGVCPVRLDVASPYHTTADILVGDTYALVTSGHGSAQILWVDTDATYGDYYGGTDPYYGDDSRWAYVRLGAAHQASRIGKVTQSSGIPAMSGTTPGHGTFTFVDEAPAGTAFSLSSVTGIVGFNITDKILAQNAYVKATLTNGYWYIDVIDKCSNLS